jgi:hypothetical protein
MNTGTDVKENAGNVNLSMDMLDIEGVIVLIWGAMALNDRQVARAWDMAKALLKADAEWSEVSMDQFFEIIEPFMKRLAAFDDHRMDLETNRILAVLYDGLITRMAEDLGNDKEELLVAAKARYPEFEWEFHPPWECPKGQE